MLTPKGYTIFNGAGAVVCECASLRAASDYLDAERFANGWNAIGCVDIRTMHDLAAALKEEDWQSAVAQVAQVDQDGTVSIGRAMFDRLLGALRAASPMLAGDSAPEGLAARLDCRGLIAELAVLGQLAGETPDAPEAPDAADASDAEAEPAAVLDEALALLYADPAARIAFLRRLAGPSARGRDLAVREDGPWEARATTDMGWVVESDDFHHDVSLRISGDFGCQWAREAYARELARRLNDSHPESRKRAARKRLAQSGSLDEAPTSSGEARTSAEVEAVEAVDLLLRHFGADGLRAARRVVLGGQGA